MLLRYCMLLIVCAVMIGLITEAEAAVVEDVIYLKNGSVVRGVIVEQIPNETLRIRTKGGSEFVFQVSEVLKITKELPIVKPPDSVQLPPPGSYINQKDPTMALVLSFLLPGAGQFYVEERNKAYVHWLVYGVSIGFLVKAVEDNYIIFDDSYDPDDDDLYGLIGGLLWLTNWVTSMVTAPSQARAFNERQQAVSLIEDRLLLESYASGQAQGAMVSLRF